MAPITLLTDFGTRDQYVAEMKGVILQIAPLAVVVDITHEIDPQDVVRAAFVLRQVWNWFPPGTVHLAVVDPGVGSRRRVIAGQYAGRYVVCPDNGLISLVQHQLQVEAMHAVENRNYMLQTVSNTFHGRDVMAPVAARLAGGLPIGEVGPPTDRVEVLQLALPRPLPGPGLAGEVLCADRFGNLVTNIDRQALMTLYRQRSDLEVRLDGDSVGPIRTGYHEVPAGEPVAIIGSADYLEIAVNCGNASQKLSAGRGSKVEVGQGSVKRSPRPGSRRRG